MMLFRYFALILAWRCTPVLCVGKLGLYCTKSGCKTLSVLVPDDHRRGTPAFVTARKARSIYTFIVEWIAVMVFIRMVLFFKYHGLQPIRNCLRARKAAIAPPRRLMPMHCRESERWHFTKASMAVVAAGESAPGSQTGSSV
jgi:hypothetical protein